MYNSKELFEVANTIGEEKLEQKNLAVFVGAFLAGLFISLGYLGYLYVTKVSNAFFGSLTFGTGLVMIIIAGGELFTGNCLLTITCFFGEKRGLKVLKNLSLVWLGNFVGAFFLVMLIVITGNALELKTEIIQLSTLKVERTFVEAFFRGVLGNVLVSLAVYLSYAAKSVVGKVVVTILPVSLFVICAFEHSVANMFLLPLGKVLGAEYSLVRMFFINLIPVTLGNFVGGGILIPFAYYIYRKQ